MILFSMNFYFIWRFWLRFTWVTWDAVVFDRAFLTLFLSGCVVSLLLLRNHYWAVMIDPGYAGNYKIDEKSKKVKTEEEGEI